MTTEKKIFKSLAMSLFIVIVFVSFFEIVGFSLNNAWIVQSVIIVFTMFFCTYTIINELKK